MDNLFTSDSNVLYNPTRTTDRTGYRPPMEMASVFNPIQTSYQQSWPDDWKDMGAIERVFSILSVGNFAVANVAKSLLDGNPGDIAGALWRGVTLQERNTFTDLLKQNGIPWAPLLGTVLDIGLDPLTWLPGPVTAFKLAAKGTKVEQALQTAGKVFSQISPVAKFNKLFNPRAGIKDIVYDTMQLETYGMQADRLAALKEWNNLAESLDKSGVRKQVYGWKVNPSTRPQNYAAIMDNLSRWDDITQRQLDLKLISPQMIKDSAEKGDIYVPILTRNWIESGWKPGKSLIGPVKRPGFTYERTLTRYINNPQEFAPDMQDISNVYKRLSEANSVDELRNIAKSGAESLKDTNPFKHVLPNDVEQVIGSYDGSLPKIKKEFFGQSVGWIPETDITNLGKLREVNLIQTEHQKRFKDFIYTSAESRQGGWVKPLTPDAILGTDRVFISQEGAKTLVKQLRQTKAPKTIATDITKVRVGDMLTDPDGGSYKVIKKVEDGFRVKDAQGTVSTLNSMQLSYFSSSREVQQTATGVKALATEVDNWAKTKSPAMLDVLEMDKGFAQKIASVLKENGITNTEMHSILGDVASAFDRVEKVFNPSNKEMQALLKFYDNTVSTWAKWATVMRWPFHVRNFFSNTSLAFLAGVEPWEMPKDMLTATLIQTGSSKPITIAGKTMSGAEWLKTMDYTGVRGQGFLNSIVPKEEIDQIIQLYETKTAKTIPGKIMSSAYSTATKVGRAVEDNARIMVAINRMGKNGGNVEDAAKHTWKYMFQYDQLTDFERGVMRRAIPFYTWMRKNIPLQVSQAINNPGRYVEQAKIYNSLRTINPETEEEHKFKPEYMQDFGYFKVPEVAKQWMEKITGKPMGNVYMNIDLPWTAWSGIPGVGGLKEPIQRLISGLNPAVTLSLGLSQNIQAFPEIGTPVARFKGEIKPAPWPFAFLPEGMWPALGLQPMKDPKSGRMVAGLPAQAVFTMYTLVPPLMELTKLFPTSKVYMESEDAPWRRVKYLTGINFTPVDANEERYWHTVERDNKLGEAVKVMSQRGKPMTREELSQYLDG